MKIKKIYFNRMYDQWRGEPLYVEDGLDDDKLYIRIMDVQDYQDGAVNTITADYKDLNGGTYTILGQMDFDKRLAIFKIPLSILSNNGIYEVVFSLSFNAKDKEGLLLKTPIQTFEIIDTIEADDEAIKQDPHYPILVDLINQLADYKVDTSIFPTREEMMRAIEENLNKTSMEEILKEVQANGYITLEKLNTILRNYASKADLSGYAKESDLKKFVTNLQFIQELDRYVLKTSMGHYVLKETGKGLSTHDLTDELYEKLVNLDINNGEVNIDLSEYQKQTDDRLTTKDKTIVGSINEVKDSIPTKTSQLQNDSGYLTEHQDLSNYATKDELHSHDNKDILDNITQDKVTSWDNKSDFSGSYNDLTDKPTIPTIPDIPTKVSQLENDANYATENFVTDKIIEASLNGDIDLSEYAKTSDIPTKVSQLENDSDFAKTSDVPTKTSDLINDSNYADKRYVENFISIDVINLSFGNTFIDYLNEIASRFISDTLILGNKIKYFYVLRGRIRNINDGVDSPIIIDDKEYNNISYISMINLEYNILTTFIFSDEATLRIETPFTPQLDDGDMYIGLAITEIGNIYELKGSSSGEITEYHTHSNKDILDTITSTMINNWNNKSDVTINDDINSISTTQTYSNSMIESRLEEVGADITAISDDLTSMDTRVNYLEEEQLKISAFDGSYNSLTGKPTIPSKTSQLENDSSFTTKEYVDYNVPHVINEDVILTISASEVQTLINDEVIDIAFSNKFDTNKVYYAEYNNKEYRTINVGTGGDGLYFSSEGFYIELDVGYDKDWNDDSTKTRCALYEPNNITNATDIVIKTKEIKYLNNNYINPNLTGLESISSVGNIGLTGLYSIAFGDYCQASGKNSVALGQGCKSIGDRTFAMGTYNEVSGDNSYAEGIFNNCSGKFSHVEGDSNRCLGNYSHVEGASNKCSGNYQHVQGKYNIEDTENKYAHIVGNGTSDTKRSNAHTLDWEGNAWYDGEVQGTNLPYKISDTTLFSLTKEQLEVGWAECQAGTDTSIYIEVPIYEVDKDALLFIELNNETYRVDYAEQSTGTPPRWEIEFYNIDDVENNIMGGYSGTYYDKDWNDSDTTAIVKIDRNDDNQPPIFTSGMNLRQIKYNNIEGFALGKDVNIYNSISIKRKKDTVIGEDSFAVGRYNEASGSSSHAEGMNTVATGAGSHAEGSSTKASGNYSHAEGYASKSLKNTSHAEGYHTIANSDYQHVQGKYNIEDADGKYAHIVGNGYFSYPNPKRSNAHTLDWNGNAWYKGKVSQDGMPTDDKDVATKKYVDGCFGVESAEVVFSNTWTLNEMVDNDIYVLENPIEHHIKPFLEAYYIIEITLNNDEKVRFTSNEASSQIDDWIDIYAEDGYINYNIYISRYTYPRGESEYLGLELCDLNWDYITDAKSISITEKRLHMIEQNQIKSVNFDAIKNMDSSLQALVDNNTKAINSSIYSSLVNGYSKECDFDMSLYNESPYDTSTKSNILDGSGIKVTTKESDGIEKASGFKLSLPINNNYYFISNLTDYWYSGKNNLVATLVTVTDGVITVKDTSKYGDNIYLFISTYSKKANTEYYILFRCKDDEDYAYIYPKYAGLVKSADYKDLRKIMFMNNKVEYTPTEDYNPATKKYVDDNKFSGSYNDLTDKPIIPSTDGLATETYVDTKVSELVDSAPETLDTLKELSTALGDDPNFATTIATQIGSKVDKVEGKSLVLDTEIAKIHEHSNKTILDNITQTTIDMINNAIPYKGVVQASGNLNNCTATGFYKIQQGASNLPINEYSFLLVYNEAGQNTLIQVWYSATSDKQRIRRRANLTWGNWYTVYTENEPPTIPSEYITETELNAKGYATEDFVTETVNNASMSGGYTHPTTHPASMITGLSTVATSGSYNDLTNKPTIPTVTNDLTDELKANYDTAYEHSQSNHAPTNAQKNSDITKSEIEAKLIGDISSHTHSQYLTEHQDISNLALKSELHSHTNKTILDNITSNKINSWDNKSDFSGSYNDLTNKPTIPTKTSQLQNDSGYLTKHQSLEGLATETYVDTSVANIVNSAPETLDTLNELATALGNDPNFATTVSNQIGNKVDKVEGKSLVLDTEIAKIHEHSNKDLLDTIEADNIHTHSNKSVIDAITSNMTTKWNKSIPFEDSYVSDCDTWLTNGYAKTSTSTAHHPSVCTGADRWGVLFYISENATNGTGTQMYFPIDGTYAGRVFTRKIMNRSAGAWNLVSTFDGNYNNLTNKPTIPSEYTLPTASADTLGGIKVGAGLSINDGVLSANGGGTADSVDWANVQNKPTIPSKTSDLTNDSGFITSIPSEYITETELEAKGYLTEHQSLDGYAKTTDLHSHTNKTVLDNITDAKVSNWNTAYTHSQTSHFSGSYNDLTDKPTIPTAYTHPTTHPASMITGLSTVATSGSYNDLSNKPTIPTKVSDLTNDSNFISSIPSEYITETELEAKGYSTFSGNYNDLTDKPTIPSEYTHPSTHPASMITGLSTVATSGSYNDLSNKPTSLPANGGNADTIDNFHIWQGTQAEYDAISSKDANTIYLIREG